MSALAKIFSPPKASPSPLPPPPRIGDAAGEAAAREMRARQRAVFGVDDTFLAPKLGNPTPSQPKAGATRTMLG